MEYITEEMKGKPSTNDEKVIQELVPSVKEEPILKELLPSIKEEHILKDLLPSFKEEFVSKELLPSIKTEVKEECHFYDLNPVAIKRELKYEDCDLKDGNITFDLVADKNKSLPQTSNNKLKEKLSYLKSAFVRLERLEYVPPNTKQVCDTEPENVHLPGESITDNTVDSLCGRENDLEDDNISDGSETNNNVEATCNKCNKQFESALQLQLHIVNRHTVQPKCEKHNCIFECKKELKEHIMKIHFKTDKNVEDFDIHCDEESTCYKCDKEFPSPLVLMNHIVNKHTSHTRCEMYSCTKVFKSKPELKEHIREAHFKYTKCKVCEARVLRKQISVHEALHRKEDIFKCDICSKQFHHKYRLSNHMKTMHLDREGYKCSYCDKTFTNSGNRYTHIFIHHNDKKVDKYFCDICNRGFYRKCYLVRHRKIHTGEGKRYECDICGLKCRSITDIKRHMFTHVGGEERKYRCETCDKSFVKNSHLVRHQAVHSEERPFKCDSCDKKYKDENSLKIHKSTEHDMSVFVCNLCQNSYTNIQSFKRHLRQQNCSKGVFKHQCPCGKRFKTEQFGKNHERNCKRKCLKVKTVI